MLEFVEEALDQIPFAVKRGIDGTLDLAVFLSWNVSASALIADTFDQGFLVIAAIGDQNAPAGQAVNQIGRRLDIRHLPWRQQGVDRQARLIDSGMDFGAQSSTRTADGVILAPFLPPAACW